MIETLFTVTGAAVWGLIAGTILLFSPLLPAFCVGWVCYTLQRWLWLRDACYEFILWWSKTVLSPIFDPILKRLQT